MTSNDADKDETARAHLAQFDQKRGGVLMSKAHEKPLGYPARRKAPGTQVWFEYSRRAVGVTHDYLYLLDEDLTVLYQGVPVLSLSGQRALQGSRRG